MTEVNDINEREYIPGFMTLNQVIASFLNKRGDYSKHDRKRLLQFAIEGYREFGLYHNPTILQEWLPVNNDIKTVSLPDQMMEFLTVGIPVQGRYWSFTELDDGIDPSSEVRLIAEREEVRPGSQRPLGDFATPGGDNQYMFKHDKRNRRLIIYSPHDLDEVLVVYRSTGIKANGETIIPIHAFQALRAYIAYEDVDLDPMIPINEKMRRFESKEYHVKNMRDFENRFTLFEFLDAVRSGLGQTFKR